MPLAGAARREARAPIPQCTAFTTSPVHLRHQHVLRARLPADRGVDRGDRVQGQALRPGQVVAGAERNDPDGVRPVERASSAQAREHVVDRAVTTGHHEVPIVVALVQGLLERAVGAVGRQPDAVQPGVDAEVGAAREDRCQGLPVRAAGVGVGQHEDAVHGTSCRDGTTLRERSSRDRSVVTGE
jgi:hypothetical protein